MSCQNILEIDGGIIAGLDVAVCKGDNVGGEGTIKIIKMKTLKIEIINPRAKKLLRELSALNLINIVPKRKSVVAVPKEESRKTETIVKDDYPDWCRRMDEYQTKIGIPQLSEEELVAEIAADIKEYRREKYVGDLTMFERV